MNSNFCGVEFAAYIRGVLTSNIAIYYNGGVLIVNLVNEFNMWMENIYFVGRSSILLTKNHSVTKMVHAR